jgi:hypothetical protein
MTCFLLSLLNTTAIKCPIWRRLFLTLEQPSERKYTQNWMLSKQTESR